MAKGDIGTNLIYRPNNRFCVLVEKDDKKFTVKFLDDGSLKEYSIGSFGSKFGLAPKQDEEVKEVKEIDRALLEENTQLKKQVEELSKEVERLKGLLNLRHSGGRPRKFGEQEAEIIEQIIYYRKQGESYRELASRFNCAASYVCKVVNDNKDRFI